MASEILIAHSDKADQEEFRRIFEGTDYRPVFSDNGEEALLRARLFKPDLIIAGVSLGEKGGLELCEALKADAECKDIPFILLTEIFEEISEKDRLRVGANGIISKPLREIAILGLLDHLIEEKNAKDAQAFLEPKKGRESVLNLDLQKLPGEKDAEFTLDELGETEEEIVELVDVIEEPEPKMSINDFVALEKEEPAGDMTPLESWGDLLGEEKKPAEPREKGRRAPLEKAQEKEKAVKPKPVESKKEVPPEDELFEKIELEEILEKVERMKPSLESEWPAEEGKPVEWQPPVEKEGESVEWQPPAEAPTEEFRGFEDFETALKGEVKGEHLKEELQPLSLQGQKIEVPTEVSEDQAKTKEFAEEELEEEELPGEEFPEALLEEELTEEEISAIEEPERAKIDIFEELEAPRALPVEKPEERATAISEEVKTWQAPVLKEPPEERIDIFEELEALKAVPAEKPEERATAISEEVKTWQAPVLKEPPEERIDIFEGLEALKAVPAEKPEKRTREISEEVKTWEAPAFEEQIPFVREPVKEEIEISKERRGPRIPAFEKAAGRGIPVSPIPPAGALGGQMEEIIAKGIQGMIGDFITKVVPEMTQNIVGLTVERIEKMVREIVPDIAEKVIQEEIKRLQKGEKD